MTVAHALIASLLLSFPIVSLHAQQRVLRYRATHGEKSYVTEYRFSETADLIELSDTADGTTDVVRWMKGSGTVSWRETTPADGTDISGERSGDVVRMRGTLKGKQFSRELRIDASPWYQIFGPLMAELLPPGEEQREFWVMNPDDISAHKMLVRRAGRERITVNGVAVDAEKIHLSPAGALALFWGADFWYRPSDALYVLSRMPEQGSMTVATIEGPGN